MHKRLLGLSLALVTTGVVSCSLLSDGGGNVVANTVLPSAQTTPLGSDGDADDPAIWIHPTAPSLSLILGTAKEGGIRVYGLDGQEVQALADGHASNTDVLYDFPLSLQTVDIAAVTNRTTNTVDFYRIDPGARRLVALSTGRFSSGVADAYGLCLYRSPETDTAYVFVTDRDSGKVVQWELSLGGGDLILGTLRRTLTLSGTCEGLVADAEYGYLYVAEEDRGIWRYGAEPDDDGTPVIVDRVSGAVRADVEGLTIYYAGGGRGFLIASSQGDSTFAVYDRQPPHFYRASFRIGAVAEAGIDATRETDGIDVINVSLMPQFPSGLFIAQDGDGGSEGNSFRLVPWQNIANSSTQIVEIDTTGYDPRSPSSLATGGGGG